MTDVRIGQLWVDNDPRAETKRYLYVTDLEGDRAVCESWHDAVGSKSRTVRIKGLMGWGINSSVVDDRGNTAGAARGNTSWERCGAVRAVASMACDAGEAVEVWAMLGLKAEEGRI